MTTRELTAWVDEVASYLKPDGIRWCDGSKLEARSLEDRMVEAGTMTPLNEERFPHGFVHRRDPTDGRDVRGRPAPAGRPAPELTTSTPPTPYLDWLREGRIGDDGFDDLYPMKARAVSSTFWTPIRVAMRASQLLVHDAATRVLDVGSGAGKFCIVGAAITGAQFVGVEHRVHLVETARAAAARVGVTNAEFVHGTFDAMDIATFDAVYLYNPFEENVWDRRARIDESVELSRERFLADVERAERFLEAARAGTRVVTYHGFGGEMPPAYRLALTERCHSGRLDLWVRQNDPMSPRRATSERRCDALSMESPSISNGALPRTSVESANRATAPPVLAGSFIASQDPPPDIPSRGAMVCPPVLMAPP